MFERAAAAPDRLAKVAELRRRLADTAPPPDASPDGEVLVVPAPLDGLLPRGGLPRGGVVSVLSDAVPGTSESSGNGGLTTLLFTLLAGPVKPWAAFVGFGGIGAGASTGTAGSGNGGRGYPGGHAGGGDSGAHGAGPRGAGARGTDARGAGSRGEAHWAGWGGARAALGMAAAAELGVDLDRTVLIPDPGADVLQLLSVLVDGVDVVVLHAPNGPIGAPARQRVLASRLRQRGTVLVVAGPWPGADVALTVSTVGWAGLGAGHGRLRDRELRVRLSGRRLGGHTSEVRLLLTAASPGVGRGRVLVQPGLAPVPARAGRVVAVAG